MTNKSEQEFVFSPELDVLRQHEAIFNHAMIGALGTHDDKVDAFSPLEHDAKKYPFQRMDCYKALGVSASIETIDVLASLMYPNFEKTTEYLINERDDLLNHIVDTLEQGKDINSVTDHSNVIGVAVCGVAIPYALYKTGKANVGDFRTEIFASSMIKNTAIFVTEPVVSQLQSAFDITRFTIPSTNSNNREFLSSGDRELFHRVTFEDMQEDREQRDRKAIWRSIAGSGTRDKKTPWRLTHHAKIHMGPITNGTVEILKVGRNLPMGIDMSHQEPKFFIGGLKPAVKNEQEAHNIMHQIAKGMEIATGISRQYHMTRASFKKAT